MKNIATEGIEYRYRITALLPAIILPAGIVRQKQTVKEHLSSEVGVLRWIKDYSDAQDLKIFDLKANEDRTTYFKYLYQNCDKDSLKW